MSTISCGYGREFFQVFSYKTQIGKKAIPVPKKAEKRLEVKKYVLRYIKELLQRVDQQVDMLVVFYTAPVM